MEEFLKEFLNGKNDQIIRAHTIADLAYNGIQATNLEIKEGFKELSGKMDSFHKNFVTIDVYTQNRAETFGMIAKLEQELDTERQEHQVTRGLMKRWGGAFAVIIFIIGFLLK